MFFLMSVLTAATLVYSREAKIKIALILQQDFLLSHYSEILEDRYGLYATSLANDYEASFHSMTANLPDIDNYRSTGLHALQGPILYEEVLRFSGPRCPIQVSVRLLDRLNLFRSNLLQNIPVGTMTKVGENLPILSGETYNISFHDIIEILQKFQETGRAAAENAPSEETVPSMDELLSMVSEYKNHDPYENDISRTIKSELSISEKTLNELSDFAEVVCSMDAGDLVHRLTFEWYVAEMFSCKVNYSMDGSRKVPRTDMRGRVFDALNSCDAPEIEKIIFGQDSDSQNVFLTQMSIQGIRFVSNLIANLSDSTQRARIKTFAAAACTIVAFASGGTIAVPPEAAEAAVLVIRSATQAAEDYERLMRGESVELVPVEGFEKLETRYSDYLSLLLLVVPKDIKLERIRSIIEANTIGTEIPLYTSIGISCTYRGKRYFCEGGYHE
jgi:hypothetical protein